MHAECLDASPPPPWKIWPATLLGRRWRTAVEVELTRKIEARVAGILRVLLAAYDDVVYRVRPGAGAVVERAAAGLEGGERVFVRPFPPAGLAAIA